MHSTESIIITLFLLGSSLQASLHKPAAKYPFVADQIIVKFAPIATDAATKNLSDAFASSGYPHRILHRIFPADHAESNSIATQLGLDRIYAVETPNLPDPPAFCRQLQNRADIEWAEPVFIFPIQDIIPNDPRYSDQSHLPQISAPQAWEITKGSPAVPIAIIDTGVDWRHPDLISQIWHNLGEDANQDGFITAIDSNGIDDDQNGYIDDFIGWDFVTGISGNGTTDGSADEDNEIPDNNPMDLDGHGTHVAGLAGAISDNGIGITGVSWDCPIMPLRIGWHGRDGNGYGRSDWMGRAFIYAADNGAKVANLSYATSRTVLEGARYAFLHDVAIATAAGNEDTFMNDALGSSVFALAVAAVDENDQKAYYSSYGERVDISAPGGGYFSGLWSTTPNNAYNNNRYYNAYRGTSMASPVTAGVMALIRAASPGLSNVQTYYQVVESSDNIYDINTAYTGLLGRGRVNAYRAVTETVDPQPQIALQSYRFREQNGNLNGLIEPGEEISLTIYLENRWARGENIRASLLSQSPYISISNASVNFDKIYGLEDYPQSTHNEDSPFLIQIADSLPPMAVNLEIFIDLDPLPTRDTIQMPIHPLLLFVDDHLGGGDGSDEPIAHYYQNALQDLNITYEYRLNDTEIDSDFLQSFPIVIWDCEWAFPSLSAHDRDILGAYLENGGHLFLSGQDIGWDLCDLSADNNERYASGGASRSWYEYYLATRYLNDGDGQSPMSGSSGTFLEAFSGVEFFQPGRDEYQYPSVVEALENGYPLLRYPDGQTAAVAADSPYTTIYFAFGGWEAISDSTQRSDILAEILKKFSGIHIDFTPLADTQESGPFPVSAEISTAKTIRTAALWYRLNQEAWQYVPLMAAEKAIYSAEIPELSLTQATISYYLFVKASDGSYAITPVQEMHAGRDTTAPAVQALFLPDSSINMTGPYYFALEITDDRAVDTNAVLMHLISDGREQEFALLYDDDHRWSAEIRPERVLADGDSLRYYFTARDLSQPPNTARYPAEDTLSLQIRPRMVLDRFENNLSAWIDTADLWQIIQNPDIAYEGQACLLLGSNQNYPEATNATIELRYPLVLKHRSAARLRLYESHLLEQTDDTVLVEIRPGNDPWQALYHSTQTWQDWQQLDLDLTPFCGDNYEELRLRFRLHSQQRAESTGRFGVKFDRLEITTESNTAQQDGLAEAQPDQFCLLDAYPNPFNPSVTIPYELPSPAPVTLQIYDLAGQLVYQKQRGHSRGGRYEFQWQAGTGAKPVPSGIYFIRLESEEQWFTSKILLLK